MPLRLGLKLRNALDVTGAEIQATAQLAERIGFDSVWIDSHVVVPAAITSRFGLNASGRPPFDSSQAFADPFVTLAFAAAATTRIRVGTAVIPYMSTHALSLAKQAATLDRLSAGRFELGLGAGWLAEEGVVLGHAVDQPTARMADAIDILRSAWRDGRVEWHSQYHDFAEVGLEPRPTQADQVPIWIGGAGPAAVRVAVAKHAGVLLSNPDVEAVQRTRLAFEMGGVATRIGAVLGLGALDLAERVHRLHAAGLGLAIVTSAQPAAALVHQLVALRESLYAPRDA